jgi:hypothetical protein
MSTDLRASGSHIPVAQTATSQADSDLERRIQDAKVSMLAARSPSLIRYWAAEMTQLIGQRSCDRIREMEEAQGLR